MTAIPAPARQQLIPTWWALPVCRSYVKVFAHNSTKSTLIFFNDLFVRCTEVLYWLFHLDSADLHSKIFEKQNKSANHFATLTSPNGISFLFFFFLLLFFGGYKRFSVIFAALLLIFFFFYRKYVLLPWTTIEIFLALNYPMLNCNIGYLHTKALKSAINSGTGTGKQYHEHIQNKHTWYYIWKTGGYESKSNSWDKFSTL